MTNCRSTVYSDRGVELAWIPFPGYLYASIHLTSIRPLRMRFFSLLFLIGFPILVTGQSAWTSISGPLALQDTPLPEKYQAFDLDYPSLANQLASAPQRSDNRSAGLEVLIPGVDGNVHSFQVYSSRVMHPDLAQKFPEIRTYVGFDPENPATWIHLDLGPKGFHAMISTPWKDIIYIDPVDRKSKEGPYMCYQKADYSAQNQTPFSCLTETGAMKSDASLGRSFIADEMRRTYRLALACTGEYAAFHGGTKADALAAMVVTINRINGLYEREFGVWLELIADNDKIIYLNAGTDPFNNTNLNQILGQNQTNTDNVIGSANYDMGHVFGTEGGGLATLNSPCNNNNKARAGTGLTNPVGDVFDIDYVAHEMGHQFGCDHTFNNACSGNRNESTAWEPGSGNTIMGYTGICAPNIQDDSDPYFHGGSLNQARIFITEEGGNTCPEKVVTGNQLPLVEAGSNYIIPKATPFELTAEGSDPDGDILTFTWEQFDNDIADMPPSPANADGPTFKSVLPDTTPVRIFPSLPTILNNSNSTWEVLPAVSRVMNFRVTARDNHPGHGLFAQDGMIVNVTEESGPFQVIYPNSVFPTWRVGDTLTITWDVANTDQLPVQCTQVDILLSLDGGYTWPVILGNHVANDGQHTIVVPLALSNKCRVKVKGVGNIFFDISNASFAIKEPSQPTFFIQGTPDQFSRCLDNSDTLSISLILQPLGGFSDTVFLDLDSSLPISSDLPDFLVLSAADTIDVHIWNILSVQSGSFPINLIAMQGLIQRSITFQVDLVPPITLAPVINTPPDNQDSISTTTMLTWEAVDQADHYRVEISLSPAFGSTNLVDSLVRDPFLNVHLEDGQIFYWRVTAQNACGFGPPSGPAVFRTRFSGCTTYTPESLPVVIPSNQTFNFNSTVSIPDAGFVTDVNVNVDLTHTYLDDVTLRLIHPDGTGLTLVSKVCNNGQNILATFDDAGTPFFCSGNPAVSGTVTPENGILSVFNGKPVNGTWTLRIVDGSNQNGGTMNLWQLELCQQVPLPPALLLANLEELAVPYCDSAALLSANLEVTASDTTLTPIELKLRVAPRHGTLVKQSIPIEVGDVVLQSDIDQGEIFFVHDGSGVLTDSFMVDAFRPSDQGWLPGIIVPVKVFTNLTASILQVEDVLCPGDSTGALTIQFTGGKLPAEFRILPDGEWQSDSLLTGLPEGHYDIVVRDANGLETTPINGIVGGPPAWVVTSEVIANTIHVTADGAHPPYVYDLDGLKDSTGTFTVTIAGTYTIVVQDSLGCQTAIDVEFLPLGLEVSITEEILCFGDSTATLQLLATGGEPPFLYRLNGGVFQSASLFSDLPAGEYVAEVIDASGTTLEIGVINILQPDSLELVAQQVQDSVVQLTATGGTMPYLYQIGIGSVQEEPVFGGLPDGLYTFHVIDANGCVTAMDLLVMNTAIEDPDGPLKEVVVRPNPSNGSFELVLPSSFQGSWSWIMKDITGRTARTGIAVAGAQVVSCEDCPSGIYILHLHSADGQEVNLRVMIW
ncbi:MAG: proprotein convertase P-domain-containing protein [Saprospiraceae bacterium]|nr:proprotein convertase P-domain-containing protein [Saprospiraceae bacterium]